MSGKLRTRARVLFTLLFGVTVWMVPTPADAGPSWSIEASPSRSGYNNVHDVSCVSPTACTAVGYSGITGGTERTEILVWNGSTWSFSPSPDREPRRYRNNLASVSCVSTRSCKAVGESWNTAGSRTLIESWNGSSWSISPSPTTRASTLTGVSCVAANRCKAVGYSQDGPQQALIESWNGTVWSISPNGIGGNAWLMDVSCVSASSCMAVGYANDLGPRARTVVLSWNGNAWSRIASPNRGTASALDDVACVSTNSCMAVGSSLSGGRWRTLVESWNGTRWSIVSSPNGDRDNWLRSVSCASANSCKAVGYHGDSHGDHTLVLSWNGSTWTRMSSPDVPAPISYNELRGVSCATASSCKAVGTAAVTTLVESYG